MVSGALVFRPFFVGASVVVVVVSSVVVLLCPRFLATDFSSPVSVSLEATVQIATNAKTSKHILILRDVEELAHFSEPYFG